jgi:hypothetical protein
VLRRKLVGCSFDLGERAHSAKAATPPAFASSAQAVRQRPVLKIGRWTLHVGRLLIATERRIFRLVAQLRGATIPQP